MIDYSKVADTIKAMQALTDEELAYVVGILASDYGNNVSSTMGAMCYVFTTSDTVRAKRKATLRYQANHSKD